MLTDKEPCENKNRQTPAGLARKAQSWHWQLVFPSAALGVLIGSFYPQAKYKNSPHKKREEKYLNIFSFAVTYVSLVSSDLPIDLREIKKT